MAELPQISSIVTVGHSNVPLEEFLALILAHEIQALADVRSFPTSRRHPHFSRDALGPALQEEGIDYRWFPGLGGRRRLTEISRHIGWRVPGFQAYADYMEKPEFEHALAEFLDWAAERRTAVMCAERLWWQCHRRLLSDRLVTRGIEVRHIQSEKKADPHRLTEFARLEGDRLVYDVGLFGGRSDKDEAEAEGPAPEL